MKDARYLLYFSLACFTVAGAAIWPIPKPPAPMPMSLEPPVPLQEWTTADAGTFILRSVASKIPEEPVPGQKTDCDPELGEVELNGGCWMETNLKPPCPKGKLWAHENRCWRPVPKTARRPTSGDVKPLGVAEP